MAKSIAKPRIICKSAAQAVNEQPLLSTNPQAVLPLLSMIGQAQLSIDELIGQLSRQFIEQMLLLSAQSVAGTQHKGRHSGEVRWHGTQNGVVAIGHAKLRVKRPRLRSARAEVAIPAYNALASDASLSRRIADIMVCNVSTRKYARVVHRCAHELGIEINSPGGPYGNVTVANFGDPGVTDYRNPNIADVLKTFGFIQAFGRGIATARRAMLTNGNPALEFTITQTAVVCTLRGRA